MPNEAERTVREAVGVFDDAKTLETAVDELLSSGFDRSEISLLAGARTVEKKLGHIYQMVSELEDDPGVPRTAFVGTDALGDAEGWLVTLPLYLGALTAVGAVVATGGTLATAIAAAVAAGGTGGALGSILAVWVGKRHARHLHEQVEHGGLLLWVRTRDAKHEERALAILSRHSAHDVHAHDLPTVGL